MAWLHWSSFWIGVLCAWSLPWMIIGAVAGACRAIREHERRRIAPRLVYRGLGDPFEARACFRYALAGRRARRDREAAEELIRSLSRSA